MANIQSNLNKIKNAVLGVDVRDSIHDGIKAINEEVEDTTDRQVQLEGTFDELVINAGNSNAEVAAARVDSTGKSHGTLGKRLNNFDSQIKDIEQKKLNKDGIVTMANMGQDVKEAMTGGSVAVVGENTILNENIVDKQVSPNKTSFISEKRNLFDKQIYVRGIVSSVNGSIISNDNFACSNFIHFEKGKTYNITSCYDYAIYNKDKVFIRGIEHPKAPLTFKSDSDDEKYIMYTMDLSEVETNMMCEGELPSEYIDGSYGKNGKISLSNEFEESIIEVINSQKKHKFYLKTWNALGDSITEHNGKTSENYHDFIKSWTGINVNNYGISGTGYTETTSTPNNRFIQRVSSMDNSADIVTVFGGINDFYFGTKVLGQFGDKTSDTFYGAVDELLLALINKFPTKTIAVFTPLISTLALNPNSKGETLNQYVDAIIEVCNHYAIPVLDLNKISGLNPNVEVIKTNYIPDGTHPNENGHEKIAHKILSFLESL